MDEPYSAYSFLLDRTARKVKQYAQQQFKKMGFNLTVDQWIVLRQLDQHKEMKQNELAAFVFKDNPTLTRIIDLLVEKDLVQRKPHTTDRRCFLVSLTAAGKQKVRALKPQIRDVRLQAWEGLSDRDFSQFKRILNTIYKNLDNAT